MAKRKLLSVIIMLFGGIVSNAAVRDLRINEVMQSNVDFLMVDKDFPDSWVELYNPTDADVDLQWCYVGLSNSIPEAWREYIISELL